MSTEYSNRTRYYSITSVQNSSGMMTSRSWDLGVSLVSVSSPFEVTPWVCYQWFLWQSNIYYNRSSLSSLEWMDSTEFGSVVATTLRSVYHPRGEPRSIFISIDYLVQTIRHVDFNIDAHNSESFCWPNWLLVFPTWLTTWTYLIWLILGCAYI